MQFTEVSAFMSERGDGSMKLLPGTSLNSGNRERFFRKAAIYGKKIVAAEIIHGNRIEMVDEASPGMILGADGLATRSEDVFLSVTVADCIPVFFYDSQAKIVAIAHCGWRGVVSGVIENAIDAVLRLGGNPGTLCVALGPGINACHFEIKEDVLDEFKDHHEFIGRDNGRIFVDLKGIIRRQLSVSGIGDEHIEDNRECTMENREKYFSFRRDRPTTVEAMVAIIGMTRTR